jgi:hypothetical protein
MSGQVSHHNTSRKEISTGEGQRKELNLTLYRTRQRKHVNHLWSDDLDLSRGKTGTEGERCAEWGSPGNCVAWLVIFLSLGSARGSREVVITVLTGGNNLVPIR